MAAATKRKVIKSDEVKPITPRGAVDLKYMGVEPVWTQQPADQVRKSALLNAMNWYNYYFDKKEARAFIQDWLLRKNRKNDLERFKSVPESAIKTTMGWLARMNTVGLALNETEANQLDTYIKNQVDKTKSKLVKVDEAVAVVKPNIQDRMREKVIALGGDLEGCLDDFVIAGANARAADDFKPIEILRNANPAPQMVGELVGLWQQRIAEFEKVVAGRDAQLVEGYSKFTKVQMKNLIKVSQSVIDACASYVQIKKVERKPRKKKAVSPAKVAQRFKYLRESADPKVKSIDVTSLVNASEAWLYNVKKRKLIHVVADTHAGTFTIKSNTLIGISPADTVQKTLRKPAEQLKALMQAGKPAARKLFKDIKATEVKFNGRGNNDLLILRAW